MKNIVFIVMVLFISISSVFGAPVDNKSSVNGDWNDPATWGGTLPSAGESIEITDSVAVTADELDAFGALTIKNGGILTVLGTFEISFASLTYSGAGNDLQITGTMNVGSITVTSTGNTIEVYTGGALNVSGAISLSGSSPSLTISNEGTVTADSFSSGVTSSVTVDGDLDVTNTLDMDGTLTGTGSVSAGNYTGGGTIFGTNPDTLTDGQVYIDGGGTATLPIELTSFTAQNNSNNVILNWTTATEENNEYFTIERSADGIDYVVIGTVIGAGNSFTSLSYSLTDSDPLVGVAYYRLSQTDYNGDSETFNPVSVAFLNEAGITIGPNPATKYLNIAVDGEMGSNMVNIYNLIGARVKSVELVNSISTIDVSDLPKGTYLVVLQANSNSITKRIIVN